MLLLAAFQTSIASEGTSETTASDDVHLFVLSGQSNMAGLDPDESFTPAVVAAFGKEKVIVVKDAKGGEPIRRWYKKWKSDQNVDASKIGDLYDRLMGKVKEATNDRQLASVTFVWMQGERDAREANAEYYSQALLGVVEQLKRDLDVEEVNVVIGRLSDFDLKNERYPHWTKIREVQVKIAESNENFAWVNTDDLNDGLNRRGKPISNDLHYSAEGYKLLGNRFAETAIELIRH